MWEVLGMRRAATLHKALPKQKIQPVMVLILVCSILICVPPLKFKPVCKTDDIVVLMAIALWYTGERGHSFGTESGAEDTRSHMACRGFDASARLVQLVTEGLLLES